MNWLRRIFGLEKKTPQVRKAPPGVISQSPFPQGGISQPQTQQDTASEPPTTKRRYPQVQAPQGAKSKSTTPQRITSQQQTHQGYAARPSTFRRIISQAPAPNGVASQSPSEEAQDYIENIHKKMDKLVSDFAAGMINRTQFQVLYSHYQTEISQIESIMATQPEAWEKVSTKGESVLLRKRYIARAQAYAIYDNDTGLPLGILGSFRLDPALVIPMLSAYRSATHEIFGSSLRLTQHEDGQWLCFVSGTFTTLLAVFTDEPIARQLQYLNELHQHFERANEPFLMQHPIDGNQLIYPHEYFLGKWQR